MKLISYSGRCQPLWKIWKAVGIMTFPNKNPWFQTTNQVLRYDPPIFFHMRIFNIIHILSIHYPCIIHIIHILSIYYTYTNYPYTNYPYVIYIIYIIPFNFIYTSTGATFLHRKKPPAAVQQPRPQDGPWLWHGPLEEQLGHQWRVEDHVRITNGDLKMGDFSEMSPKIWLG